MDPRERRALLFVVLGVVLLANPVYLYPEDVSYRTTYTFEASETDRVSRQPVDTVTEIAWCDWHPVRSARCVVARDMAAGDSIEYDLGPDETVGDDLRDYDYVDTGDGFYAPSATVEDGTLILSLDPVPRETVKRALPEEFDGVPRYVRRAVRNGSVTVSEETVPYETRTFYVRHDGTYYLVEPVESERVPTGWGWRTPPDVAVDAMRLTAWIAGVGLLWRAGEWSERARRAAEREGD